MGWNSVRSHVVRSVLCTACTAGMFLTQDVVGASKQSVGQIPKFELREAPFIQMPGVKEYKYEHAIDCNSPLHWDGDTLYLFNSFLHPYRSEGSDISHLGKQSPVHLGDFDDLLDI